MLSNRTGSIVDLQLQCLTDLAGFPFLENSNLSLCTDVCFGSEADISLKHPIPLYNVRFGIESGHWGVLLVR